MRNINRNTGDNWGVLEKFYFTAPESIVGIPAAKAGVIKDNIQMALGTTWYAFGVTPRTLSYQEPFSPDRNGGRFKMQLKGFIAKETPEIKTELDQLYGRPVVLLYKEYNGFFKLVGSKEHYLELELDLDTGGDPASRNGISFSFKGDNTREAYFYEGAFTVSQEGVVAPPPPPEQVVTIRRGDGQVVAKLLPGQTFEIISGFSWGFRII